jgi:hypothetical protein
MSTRSLSAVSSDLRRHHRRTLLRYFHVFILHKIESLETVFVGGG